MSTFIKLAELLASAGFTIVEFHDEFYDKEPHTLTPYRGINLRIMRVGPPKTTPEPPEAP